MSESYGPVSTSSPGTPSTGFAETGGTTGASDVKDTAKAEAGNVVGTAKHEAGAVASQAKSQAKTLYSQTKGELRQQASRQQQRAADGLRSTGDQLRSMASSASSPGLASDLVQQAADRVSGAASWLGDRDPESLLAEVKSFARRKPGIFVGAAALAGLVAGRLVRALAEGNSDRKADMTMGAQGSLGSADLTGRATGMTGGAAWGDGDGYAAPIDTTLGAGGTAAGSGYGVTEFDDSPRGETTGWTGGLSEEGTDYDRRNNPL